MLGTARDGTPGVIHGTFTCTRGIAFSAATSAFAKSSKVRFQIGDHMRIKGMLSPFGVLGCLRSSPRTSLGPGDFAAGIAQLEACAAGFELGN